MAFRHFLMVFRPKQDAVVAIYGILPPFYWDSPETDEVAALYGISPLPYGVSPETQRISGYLRRSAAYLWRVARNKGSRHHLLLGFRQDLMVFRNLLIAVFLKREK